MTLDSSIPKIELPFDGIHKVVQFLVDGIPYLRFRRDYHTDIVKRFADEIGVKAIVDIKHYTPLFFLPDENMICGMGRCELNLTDRKAEFYGTSTDYYSNFPDIGAISEEHLELIKPFSQNINMTYNPLRYR